LPELELPELKTNNPLAPSLPAFKLLIEIRPLLDAVPSPLVKDKEPPVLTTLRPPVTIIAPPAPLVPEPTESSIIPPPPAVAAPVPILSAPLFPLLALPELNTNSPLDPRMPAFILEITTAPLLDAVPSPVAKLKLPPVFDELRPAFP
jgi:hypothetical protein